MRTKWTKEENNLFFSLCKYKTIDELALLLGKDREQIKSKGWRNGITFMNYWTEYEDDYLMNNYKSKSYDEIGKVLGRSKSAVQSRCRKFGLMKGHRSYKKKFNSDYFASINTEEKAYWLGFISADGCISKSKDRDSYHFKITLQRSDADFLRKFIVAIDGEFDVRFGTASITTDGVKRCYETCEVAFRDQTFAHHLLKYITPNKTEYLRIPNEIPNNLIRHFIRGFADGDGCFYCNPNKRDKSFEIVGKCYEMLDDIRSVFENNGIYSKIFVKRRGNWKLMVLRLEDLIKLNAFLYNDATIYLERKYDKSQEIVKLAS